MIPPANAQEEEEDDTILSSITVNASQTKGRQSCRTALFQADGRHLYTSCANGSIHQLDVERSSSYTATESSITWSVADASPHSIGALHQLEESAPAGPLVVTGDDEGCIRLWDVRVGGGNGASGAAKADGSLPTSCIASFKENGDYISGFEVDNLGHTLLASSADGKLTVLDIRKGPKSGNQKSTTSEETQRGPFDLLRQSDPQDDELLSICKLKHGKKIVCGTGEGVLNVWSWGTWGDISDRFPGHPQSIDALLKVDEDTIITGSSDGVLRLVQIHPDELLGIIGDNDGFPCEKVRFCAGNKGIACVSHDNLIRLWDASILFDEDAETDDEGAKDKNEQKGKVASSTDACAKGGEVDSEDDWEDESMDDSDSDDSDDSDEGGKKGRKGFKTENEKFFEDL
jgi:hypothetical protein